MSIILNIYIYESTNKMENLGIKSFHFGVTATLACLTVTYIVNSLSQNALWIDFEYTSPVS